MSLPFDDLESAYEALATAIDAAGEKREVLIYMNSPLRYAGETYYQAIRTAPPSRIQAIDMGRRALHDEVLGAPLLRAKSA